ncbi:MAG: hypothetical protein JW834_03205 [Candidatus Diapherotrites archaeon]|nr:hypothetical protein [Candidatus Diapherotrites archaeon]
MKFLALFSVAMLLLVVGCVQPAEEVPAAPAPEEVTVSPSEEVGELSLVVSDVGEGTLGDTEEFGSGLDEEAVF